MDDFFRVRKGLQVANSSLSANLTPDQLTIDTLTANAALINTAAINVVGCINVATFFAATSANVGANVQITTAGATITFNTNTFIVNSSIIQLANATATANIFPNRVQIGGSTVNTGHVVTGNVVLTGGINANGAGYGTSGQVLASDGANVYWSSALLSYANTTQYMAGSSNTVLLTPKTVWASANQQVLTDAATIAIDCANGFNFGDGAGSGVLLAGNRGLGNPTSGKDGMGITMWFKATGSTRTLASNTKYGVHSTLESFPLSIATTEEVCIAGMFTNTTFVRITSIMRF